MLCEVGFAVLNITYDILQITDIALGIKRVYRYLKRNTLFSAYFFSKNSDSLGKLIPSLNRQI